MVLSIVYKSKRRNLSFYFADVTRKKKAVDKGSTIRERDKKNAKYYVGDYYSRAFKETSALWLDCNINNNKKSYTWVDEWSQSRNMNYFQQLDIK